MDIDEGAAIRRRERGVRQENPQSTRLCFFLRHYPAKDQEFARKGQAGGWFTYEDTLKWFRNTTEQQLDDIVANSRSFIPPHAHRFESRVIQGVKWIRARYGHSYDTSFGDVERDRDADVLPTLSELLIDLVVANLPQYLSQLDQIADGSIISEVFSKYKNRQGGKLTNKFIKAFLLPQVSELNFKGVLLEDSIIRLLPKSCPSLYSLSFAGCYTAMTDANLQYILKRCGDLRELDISGCQYLTTTGYQHLAKLGSRLTSLSVRWLKSINKTTATFLLQSLPELQLFNITGCPQIQPSEVEELGQAFPNVYIQQYDSVDAVQPGDLVDNNAEDIQLQEEEEEDEAPDQGGFGLF